MPAKEKIFCDEPGCPNIQWKGKKCWRHHPINVAKRLVKKQLKGTIKTDVACSKIVAEIDTAFKQSLSAVSGLEKASLAGIPAAAYSLFEKIGLDIGRLVTEKNQAYGNSFAVSGRFLTLLYPDGIHPDQYEDMLGVARVFDKMKRIATDQDAFGESPWNDIAGYGVLGVARKQGDL